MTTEYTTLEDKEKLLKMLVGAVCTNLSANDEKLEENRSSGSSAYKNFKAKMLVANHVEIPDAKRARAREAMAFWNSTGVRVQNLIDYVMLLNNALELFDDVSKKNDVWSIPHRATQLQTRPPGPQGSNFTEFNTPVNVRNSDKIHLLLNRIHELVE
jgi:hypothetical protein